MFMKNRFFGLSMFFWFRRPSKCDILALFRTVKVLKNYLSIQNLGVKQEFIDSSHDNVYQLFLLFSLRIYGNFSKNPY